MVRIDHDIVAFRSIFALLENKEPNGNLHYV